MHRPNVWTLRCSAFIITPDEGLIVRLVALRTLKQISFSLLPKMTPDRQARNFLTCRISNVRLLHLAGQTSGDEIIYLWFKGDTTNQSFCSIQLANCNFSSTFPTPGLGLSAILRSLDYNQYLKVLFSYLDPVLINKERSRFVRCWHAETDGWAASTFHSNCDGRGPTVTIIKVNSYIFGGYTDVSWTSSE